MADGELGPEGKDLGQEISQIAVCHCHTTHETKFWEDEVESRGPVSFLFSLFSLECRCRSRARYQIGAIEVRNSVSLYVNIEVVEGGIKGRNAK